MNLFGSKKTDNSTQSASSVASDILSQVRVMGEKAPAELSSNSVLPHTPPVANNSNPNPVNNPFIQEEEAALQAFEPTTTPTAATEQQAGAQDRPALIPQPTASADVPIDEEGKSHSSKILIIGSILTVGLILIIGIFLYLESTHDKALVDAESATTVPPVTETETPAPADNTKNPPLETTTFSTTRSNYLTIDPETATKEVIIAEIAKKEAQMVEGKVVDPIVFQITDQNNIPLAISRFAYLMEFAPGEDLLAALDEDFTLVLYMEGGKIHRGIATKFKEEQENPAALLTRYEGLLPAIFRNLLYPAEVTLPAASTFSSGSYNNSIVRYSNIAEGYSFDYILQDKLLFFGNGKDVARKTAEVGIR